MKKKIKSKSTNKLLFYKILHIINKNRGKPQFSRNTIAQIREVLK